MKSNDPELLTPAKRPDFLSLLCIMSFIGIGISIIFGLLDYINYSRDAANDALNEYAANPIIMDYGKMAISSIIKTLLNIPILLSVLMMWKQKKSGFWVYLVFEIFQPVFPLLMGISLGTGVIAFVELTFSIIFIVLYSLNIKHMR